MQKYEPWTNNCQCGLESTVFFFFFGFKTFGERAQAERAGKTVVKMEKNHR